MIKSSVKGVLVVVNMSQSKATKCEFPLEFLGAVTVAKTKIGKWIK